MQNTNKVFLTLLNTEPHQFSLGSITLAKPSVLVCYKDPTAAALPVNANTDWICSKVILAAQHYQHPMLNHWVLAAEPTHKVFEGAYFAAKKPKGHFLRREDQQ